MTRFTQNDLEGILADFIGRPYRRGGVGPDAYDCYGLVKAFMGRIGVEIAEIGQVDPEDSMPVYERQQADYIALAVPRPWSLVTFSGRDLNAHIGVVLPGDDLFLHCPGRAAGKVIAEPLSRRPWRNTVDGYWWPRGYVETVVMLTPMTVAKRAWQFVRAGRTLAEIVGRDIVEGRDVPVQVFLDGQLVPQERWSETVPTELQQIVVRPVMGEGDQALMVAGMLALAAFAPMVAGAIVGQATASAVAAGAATTGQSLAYHLAGASVMMAGGLALNALVGPDEAKREGSQYYTWEPMTTQRVGSLVPLVYGTYGVRGNILCSYATSDLTYETNIWNKTEQVRFAKELIHVKVAYSDGPIEGVIDGTERLNDRDPNQYAESAAFTVERFRGTDDQEASSVADAFEVPVGLACPTLQPASTTFTAVDCDSAALVLRFPNGFTDYEKDGGHKPTSVVILAEIREEGGVWHTLMDGAMWGDSRNPMRINLALDGTHPGGSPFAITPGKRYEARITRKDNTHSDRGDDFIFECVQFGYATAQRLPGMAYTAIGAAASRELSGSIQYYAKIKGKVVCIYDAGGQVSSIEWSDNPAWIAVDLLTRPVIKGNGGERPYEVEYYKRLDPGYLVMAEWIALAAWCDEWVPDGEGGTEKRYVFNGVFDQDGSAWDQAIRVCKMACAMPYFNGHRVGVVVDKPGVPSQMFNVSNLRSGFSEAWIDNSEAATVYDVEFANEQVDYAPESYPVPLLGADRDVPASMDGFGCTKRSQAWRRASRQLRINKYMRRTVDIPGCLDAIYARIGDIVYVQHPSIRRATGGRIVEVYADGVKLDKPVQLDELLGASSEAGPIPRHAVPDLAVPPYYVTPHDNMPSDLGYAILIRTHDGTAERLNLYKVAAVVGENKDIVQITGQWEYTPNRNDLWTFGEEQKVIDLYRIKGFERTGVGQVMIQAAQYTTDYYTDDEEPPRIQVQVYSANKGGMSPSLLPTTYHAVMAGRTDDNSMVDTLIWEGLEFVGNGVSGVTWTCEGNGGAGIKYKGVWCPIFDDAVGTTDQYIYFDPNIGDPRYLQHTNYVADLVGRERYVFCVNVRGVANFKPGVRIGADGRIVGQDDVLPGALFKKQIEETFEDAAGDYKTRWWVPTLTGSSTDIQIVSGGRWGGKVLEGGDNDGADMVGCVWFKSIPFDPDVLYCIRATIRQTAGHSRYALGVMGRNAADSDWVDAFDQNSDDPLNHAIAGGLNYPTSEWVTYRGFFKGWRDGGDVGGSGSNPHDPRRLSPGVRYIRPFFVLNVVSDPAENGVIQVDNIVLETVNPQEGLSLPGAAVINGTVELSAADNARRFSTAGSTKPSTCRLPAAATSLEFEFCRDADHSLRVVTSGTDSFLGGSAGGSLVLTGMGDLVRIGCMVAGTWRVIKQVGGAPVHICLPAPLAYWTCDDDAANPDVLDSSGNGNTLTAGKNTSDMSVGGVNSPTTGALYFDGLSSYAKRAAAVFNGSAGTVMGWLRIQASQTGDRVILSSSDEATDQKMIWFGYGESPRCLKVVQRDGVSVREVRGGTELNSVTWYHVAFVSDGEAYAIYLNGEAETLTVVSGSNDGNWFGDTPDRDNVVMAALEANAGMSMHASVILDDVRAYDRAMTQQEIRYAMDSVYE